MQGGATYDHDAICQWEIRIQAHLSPRSLGSLLDKCFWHQALVSSGLNPPPYNSFLEEQTWGLSYKFRLETSESHKGRKRK